MSNLFTCLGAVFIIALYLLQVVVAVGAVVLTIYGIIAAFFTHVALGLLAFFPPLGLINGFMLFFFDYNVAEQVLLMVR